MKYRILLLPLALVAAPGIAFLAGLGKSAPPSAPPASAASPGVDAVPAYLGVAGCSARACHGRLVAADSVTALSSATHWLEHDKHADAYRVLFGPRSRQMIERLAEGTHPTPAHQDAHCLACHTIPQTVYRADSDTLVADDPAVRALRRDGVGCEACHGAARDWVVPHQTTAWDADRRANYRATRMTWLNDYLTRAEVCVGCHVGAAADPKQKLPLRDVNHDLIVAGHPRLNFELTSYQEALPPHWVEKDRSDSMPRHRPRSAELQLWLAGQVRTAEASLNLLQDRGTRGPWPEFAESSCFACHHDLAEPSWRQTTPDYYADRRAGTVPWNRWHLSRPFERLLSTNDGQEVRKAFTDLREALSKPHPDPTAVAAKAKAAAERLRMKFPDLTSFGSADTLPSKLYDASDLADIAGPTGLGPLDWDDAVQYYLLLAALQKSQPPGPDALSADAKLAELGTTLSLPRTRESYNSPRTFRKQEGVSAGDLRRKFDDLRKLVKP